MGPPPSVSMEWETPVDSGSPFPARKLRKEAISVRLAL